MENNTLSDVLQESHFTRLRNLKNDTMYSLKEDSVSVGRSPHSDVVVDDQTVSRRHIRIEKDKHGWKLSDQRTKNGTYLNNVKITQAYIPESNSIRIGQTQLKLENTNTPITYAESLVGQNETFLKAVNKAHIAAKTNLPILILGETGTGKELFARLIHDQSHRHNMPFVAINCCSIPSTLFVSELCGHIKGAFTDAKENRMGLLQKAGRGTLFLDEIGDMPANLQPTLLRLFEEKKFTPIGSNKTMDLNCRVVSATNRLTMDTDGDFRNDLFYRLGAIVIKLPPLRERPQDIPLLLNYFIEKNKHELGQPKISRSFYNDLQNYEWPGNIRELKHLAARIALFGPSSIHLKNTSIKSSFSRQTVAVPKVISKKDRAFQRVIEHALSNHGTIRKAAENLGLPKSTLAERVKLYGVSKKPTV